MITDKFNKTLLAYLERGESEPLRTALFGMKPAYIAEFLNALPPEDAVAILRLLPVKFRRNCMRHCSPETQRLIRNLLPTIGDTVSLYSSKKRSIQQLFVPTKALPFDIFVSSWKLHLNVSDIPEDAHCIYVVDQAGRLRGNISLINLALAKPTIRLVQIMEPDCHALRDDTSALDALRYMNDGGWNELPVIDSNDCYIGSIFRSSILLNLLQGNKESSAHIQMLKCHKQALKTPGFLKWIICTIATIAKKV